MSSANLDVGYPVYGARFVTNKTLVVVGGGGEGNNGIANKITVVRISFKQKEAKRRLQRFREITLPANEDSPMCVDVARAGADSAAVFVGCNQSMQLSKSMNINNNLRKYVFTAEEHLRFVDAAQLEPELGEHVGEYPKIVNLAPDNSLGCLMTSRVPSVIYIFSPELLELNVRFTAAGEIRDFSLNPFDNGKTLCYVSGSNIETISTSTTDSLGSSAKNAATTKALQRFILTKVRYVSATEVVLAANLRNGKGVAVLKYSLASQKIVSVNEISSKIKGLVAMDVSVDRNLVALAGNDFSLTLVRLSDLKIVKTFKKLHPFAITCVAFSPNGSRLATGSASNAIHVLDIPVNFASGSSAIGTLFRYLLLTIIIGVLGIVLQIGYENGQLQEGLELASVHLRRAYGYSSFYGKIAYHQAYEYSVVGYEYLKDKLKQEKFDENEDTRQYFTMSEWADVNSVSTSIETTRLTETNETPRNLDPVDTDDIISEVTKNSEEYTQSIETDQADAVPEPVPESSPTTQQKNTKVSTEAPASPADPVPQSSAQVPEQPAAQSSAVAKNNESASAAPEEPSETVASEEEDAGYEAEDESEEEAIPEEESAPSFEAASPSTSSEPIIERGDKESQPDISVVEEFTAVQQPVVETPVQSPNVVPQAVEDPIVEPLVVEDPIQVEQPVPISESSSKGPVVVESGSENYDTSDGSLSEPSATEIDTEAETSAYETAVEASESETDSETDAESETNTDARSSVEPESETGVEVGIGAVTGIRVEADEQSESVSVIKQTNEESTVEEDADIKSASESVSEVGSEAESDSEAVSDTDVESETDVESVTEIESETEIDSASETEIDSASETEIDSAFETEVESASETEIDSASETEVESSSQTDVESSSETEVESASETEVESASETEAEPASESEIESPSATESPSETEVDSSSETDVDSSDTDSASESETETTQSVENSTARPESENPHVNGVPEAEVSSDSEHDADSVSSTHSDSDSEYTAESSSETESSITPASQTPKTTKNRTSTKAKKKKKKKTKKTKTVQHDEL